MYWRIHILGASGAGTSTLGEALSCRLQYSHLDTDDFYWAEKYTRPTAVEPRLERLTSELDRHSGWVLSGSLCGWGDALIPKFDLVIFLRLPPSVRMERLKARESIRYGGDVAPDDERYAALQTFLDWAAAYDTAGPEIRSRALHEAWIAGLTCPVLRLEGDLTVEEEVEAAIKFILGKS
ncbi:AAA family ATPase [Paenibacillus sp. NFR01]|uniref:AAA family ATPase n=1 Tax=Paenibacillus sp. NFR01 TaxID=1566279 RepID=UPI0008B7E51B|nr:AAA family ATPase [Paenibacillus sp. NFR01]SET13921.1 Adenylate kinase [Paenibacillus sp. NFR01]